VIDRTAADSPPSHACYLVNNNEKNKRSSARTQKMPGTPFGPGTLREFQFPE
jgi:hypothetical protein